MKLTDVQKLAICAQLNFVLGADIFDRLFLRIDFAVLEDGILFADAGDTWCADEIEGVYALDVATVAEAILRLPVEFICVRRVTFDVAAS